jgi:Zn-dependent metalloprotease
MTHDRCPIRCIVPPYILQALAEQKNRRLREVAMRSLVLSSRLRGHRDVLSLLPASRAAAAGRKDRAIYDARHQTRLPGQPVRGEGDPESSDPAVNEAYDGLGATYDFYSEVFSRNSIDNNGLRLVASVHYGRQFDNAFWNGEQMVFGDGDNVIFVGFTKAIDVIGHELTHGLTQFEAALEYHDQPGALNESFSDVFGSLVKQYHNHQTAAEADWLIGAGILSPGINGVALRSMKEPGTAYDDPKLGGKDPQPGSMSGYVQTDEDNGGVHLNSGIPNRAFYLAATALGGYAWEAAGHIWYTSLQRLSPASDFQACANMTHSVAAELYGANEQKAVKSAWSEVGVPPTTPAGRAAPRRPAGRRRTRK